MNAAAIAIVSAASGGVAKILYESGLSGKRATAASFLISALFIYIWSLSNGGIHAANAYDYLSSYVDVLTSSAGAFHVIENLQGLNAASQRAGDAVNRLLSKPGA